MDGGAVDGGVVLVRWAKLADKFLLLGGNHYLLLLIVHRDMANK